MCLSYELLDKQLSDESSFEGQTSCGSTYYFEQMQISFYQVRGGTGRGAGLPFHAELGVKIGRANLESAVGAIGVSRSL